MNTNSNFEGEGNIESFVEQMMKDKGVEINSEEKNRLVSLLSDEIDEALIRSLPEEKLDILNKELDKGDEASEEVMMSLLRRDNDETEKMVADVMEKFRQGYLEGAK